jgi:hypothetical protein
MRSHYREAGGGRLGPIIISGMDPEDHFPAGGDMIRDIMNFVVTNSAIHQTHSKIVMFGGTASTGNTARSIATGLGFTLTQVTGTGITNADLDPLTTLTMLSICQRPTTRSAAA